MSALHQVSTGLNFLAQTIQAILPPGGVCQVVDDEQMAWEQAAQSSQNLIVYVTWTGDRPWSSSAVLEGVTHRVTRSWFVGIKRGRGYVAVRGDTFSKTTAVPAFVDLVEDIRDCCRSIVGLSEDAGTDGVHVDNWKQGNNLMSGKKITFTTKNDLPGIVATPDSDGT